MSGKHSGYFPLGWDSGVKQAMSKDDEKALHCRGLTNEVQVSLGNRVWATGFVGVDRCDMSKEVCFVRTNSGEGGSASVDMFYVPKIGYWV